ncbi:hypothetical protein [Saccharothrix deserti]|uniref:hypothetical protein n=1 Tax=Saccharothrix deserti TaxID=2593674 RepID=UPI00131DED31|nr:hypothetical protein [Saccharothrix deserti]
MPCGIRTALPGAAGLVGFHEQTRPGERGNRRERPLRGVDRQRTEMEPLAPSEGVGGAAEAFAYSGLDGAEFVAGDEAVDGGLATLIVP